jgi:hypothetical protein
MVSIPAEHELLEPCRIWLLEFLRQKHRRAEIEVLPDTHKKELGAILSARGYARLFRDCSEWEVMVDVVAIVATKGKASLVFVELKSKPIKLRDVGQLLGYCRVCRPLQAFLLSPDGLSGKLHSLLATYGRSDVLQFDGGTIHVGNWDASRAQPAWGELIPGGVLPITKYEVRRRKARKRRAANPKNAPSK